MQQTSLDSVTANPRPAERVDSEGTGELGGPRFQSELPVSVERRRGKRRQRRARKIIVPRSIAILGGLYLLSGIAGNGWMVSRLLRLPYDYLPPMGRMALILLPIIILWFILSGLALFRGMKHALKAITYTAFGMGALCIASLRFLMLVQLPATILAFFNLVLLCVMVDFRFKSDFQRMEHHHHRRQRVSHK